MNNLSSLSINHNAAELKLTIRGMQVLPCSKDLGYFSVTVSDFSRADESIQTIGFSISRDPSARNVHCNWSPSGSFQCSIPGLETFTSEKICFTSGNIIGLLVDCREYPSLCFYVNERLVYVCLKICLVILCIQCFALPHAK